MRFMAADVARAVSGELVGSNAHLSGVSFDSRTISPGQLFVPIIDQRDGHDFIEDAIKRGAGAYLTLRETQGRTAIKVADTVAALLVLGTWGRARLDEQLQQRVVAVTGSVGKTSTKDLVASALGVAFKTHANENSFNNDFGLPTTILNAPDEAQALVLEMGMRGFGEISRLCAVANPQIGIVTAVDNAHTERVGSIEGVARAKRELIEALPKSGTAILNRDDERVWAMRDATEATVLSYGTSVNADVRMSSCTIDDRGCATASVVSPWGEVELKMQVAGRHMVQNALAALCAAGVLGVDLNLAAAAVSVAKISESRMQMRKLQNGVTVIDDSYNANPASMRAALETLASLSAGRRIAFCGLMAELAEPEKEHIAICEYAAQLGIELIAVNTDLYGVDAVSFDQAKTQLAKLNHHDAALVKGSKVTGLVRLCDGL
ncbi:MAG: UDP-N-acetylmuramoyl-tripeptide--D-alanyl-D-alanine ligase [Actinomycetota bacterium]|nr:UDP-N-acetylmuramoyl-tripeptide--D-alanyl-D-alanine ligase [Actinomycetota bacterium]